MMPALKADPRAFRLFRLGSRETKNLPAFLNGIVERRGTLSGKLAHVHSDNFEEQKFTDQYFLHDSATAIFEVKWSGAGQNRLPLREDHVKIDGWLLDQVIYVEKDSEVEVHSLGAAVVGPGVKKAAVVLFNFANDTRQPIHPVIARQTMFTDVSGYNVSNYFNEISHGQIRLEGRDRTDGDVYGWLTIPEDNIGCSTNRWVAAARLEAAQAGYDLSGYDHLVFLAPKMNGCGFAGLYMGNGVSVINGDFRMNYIAHELGHWLGAGHAGQMVCYSDGSRVPLSDNCVTHTYADPYDVMGNISSNHTNVHHKAQMGFLGAGDIVDVANSGVLELKPMEFPAPGAKAIRIPRSYNQEGQVNEYFYLEYRQPYGVFDNFSPSAPVVNGISIRLAPHHSWVGYASKLIDTPPNWDDVLSPGEYFSDPASGVDLSVSSVSPSSAFVQVAINCAHIVPSIQFSGTRPPIRPGGTYRRYVTINNHDTAACLPSPFELSLTLPDAGWSSSPANWSGSIGPQQSITIPFDITVPGAAAENVYQIQFRAANIDAPAAFKVRADYALVDASDPVISKLSPADGSRLSGRGSIIVSAEAADGFSWIDHLRLSIDGVPVASCSAATCEYSWAIETEAYGDHTVAVEAVDAAGNSSYRAHTISISPPPTPPTPGEIDDPIPAGGYF